MVDFFSVVLVDFCGFAFYDLEIILNYTTHDGDDDDDDKGVGRKKR